MSARIPWIFANLLKWDEDLEHTESRTFRELYMSPYQAIQDPLQVKNPDELKVGKIYLEYQRGGETGVKLLVKSVDKKTGWFDADQILTNGYNSKGWYQDRFSLGDRGVMPYEDGMWNTFNWLVPEEALVREGIRWVFG